MLICLYGYCLHDEIPPPLINGLSFTSTLVLVFLCLLLLWSCRHYAITWVSSEFSYWKDNFCVNFLDVIGSTDSRWIQSKQDVKIWCNPNKTMKIVLLCLRRSCKLLMNCCSRWHTELEIFNIQSEKQQQSDDDLRSAPMFTSMRTAYGTQDFQHSIRAAARKRRQLTTALANCLWTANLLFMEVTHLGHQNQKELMH